MSDFLAEFSDFSFRISLECRVNGVLRESVISGADFEPFNDLTFGGFSSSHKEAQLVMLRRMIVDLQNRFDRIND